eukprot:6891640-Prymnesium_polylepis.2
MVRRTLPGTCVGTQRSYLSEGAPMHGLLSRGSGPHRPRAGPTLERLGHLRHTHMTTATTALAWHSGT